MTLQAATKRHGSSHAVRCRFAPRSAWQAALGLSLALALPAPLLAQEEAGVDEAPPFHKVAFGIEAWVAQPAGLEYTPATFLAPGTNNVTAIDTPFGTETAGRYTAEFRLDGGHGTLSGAYYSHSTTTEMAMFDPGAYNFGEVLTPAYFAGVLDDGFADGFAATTTTGLKDWQIMYGRNAFQTPKVMGDWSIGWRRVTHRRFHQANYYALISPLPPLPEPDPRLDPRPDFGEVRSEFDGRGLNGGFDVDFKLWRDRLVLETSIALAILRGDIDTGYSSVTHLYQCVSPPTNQEPQLCVDGDILGIHVPFSILSEVVDTNPGPTVALQPIADSVTQFDLPFTLSSSGSATSLAMDLSAGFRWRALDWLDATVGFRQSHYTDVGIDARLSGTSLIQGLTEDSRDATYEGFYFGLVFEVF